MKTKLALLALVSVFGLQPTALVRAATTITATNHFGYGANVGWLDGRGDVSNGAVIGEYVCSGSLYAANVGWINLGSGTPANGIRYQNNSATDFGVNQDGLGNLRGCAYGANIGWVSFESTGAPKVDLATGKLGGHAYSANCGWISLSNAVAQVQTATVGAGTDSDGDGIADAWELAYTNTLAAFTATSDTDGDGMTDQQEYLADTNPLDPNDHLWITTFTYDPPPSSYVMLEWTSRTSRFYRLERRVTFDAAAHWEQYPTGLENLAGWNNVGFNSTSPQYFYRVRAVRPLMP